MCSLIYPFLAASSVEAQTSLDALLAAGRTYALEGRIADARLAAREAEHREARARFIPALSATGSYARNQYASIARIPDGAGDFQQGVFQPHDQWDASVRVDLPLLDLVAVRRARAAGASEAAERSAREVTTQEVDRAVLRGYYDLVGATGLLAAARDAEEVARTSLSVVEARTSAGLASELDVERARAEVERARQSVADAELATRIAGRSITLLTGIEAEVDEGALAVEVEPEAPASVFLAGIDDLPAVRSADESARAVEAQRAADRSAFAPVVTAHASERFTNAVGFGHSPAYQVGVTATLRIDAVAVARVRATAAASEEAQLRAELARRDATEAIATAHDRVLAAMATTSAARAEAAAGERASRIARARYEAGTATHLDLVTAERDAFAAEVARVRAEAELAFARADLRLEAGMLGDAP